GSRDRRIGGEQTVVHEDPEPAPGSGAEGEVQEPPAMAADPLRVPGEPRTPHRGPAIDADVTVRGGVSLLRFAGPGGRVGRTRKPAPAFEVEAHGPLHIEVGPDVVRAGSRHRL